MFKSDKLSTNCKGLYVYQIQAWQTHKIKVDSQWQEIVNMSNTLVVIVH